MTHKLERATEIVSEVFYSRLFARLGEVSELASEARTIARQLDRIRFYQDAEFALKRVLVSSFGGALPLDDQNVATAARDLVNRLCCEGHLAAPLCGERE
jgi:hypothetical protein